MHQHAVIIVDLTWDRLKIEPKSIINLSPPREAVLVRLSPPTNYAMSLPL
jgi:hypothetical protein